jgi:hypothetical protein
MRNRTAPAPIADTALAVVPAVWRPSDEALAALARLLVGIARRERREKGPVVGSDSDAGPRDCACGQL